MKITKSTTPVDLDRFFNTVWPISKETRIKLRFDATDCGQITLSRVLAFKKVLNKHRFKSAKFVESTKIVVASVLAQTVLNIALSVIGTERPYVVVVQRSARRCA